MISATQRCVLASPEGPLYAVDLPAAAGVRLRQLPWSLRILLENVLRHAADHADALRDAQAILDWCDTAGSRHEVSFRPGRVLMHDTTCVPALTDIAAMRDVVAEAGGVPDLLEPLVQVDAVIDHSVAVDYFGTPDARQRNMAIEIRRNAERYRFMKWATGAFAKFRLFPPGTGILHTINLEHLAQVVTVERRGGENCAVPDTLIGTDSHTPMINALGILGWGVGGIEAESAMFGEPISLRVPDVVGVRLSGRLSAGVLATDLALVVTERLRRFGVVDCFVEFFGPGLSALTVGERAAVANMAPEYGATTGFFPIDTETIAYLGRTGRPQHLLERVETYARRQGLWCEPDETPRYTRTLDIDLDTIRPSVAGPRRPQDRIDVSAIAKAFAPATEARQRPWPPAPGDKPRDGAIAIAAITSCTNTADPGLLVAAGLVARKARQLGLRPPSYVKTSLAPGSGAVLALLERTGLLADLTAIGFAVVGVGCTTCIGNSGPLVPEMDAAIRQNRIAPVAVLSGNRNFPGRIHPAIDAAFLASPPLVVAFALAGLIDFDIIKEPIATGPTGPVFLSDLWPCREDIDEAVTAATSPSNVVSYYAHDAGNRDWAAIKAPVGPRFAWSPESTYLRRPPFVARRSARDDIRPLDAAPLVVLGDDMTTDHISPAGPISVSSEAGRYLVSAGEDPADLNVFAARRGNFEAMVRGLFTNPAARNLLCSDAPPGQTVYGPSGERLSVSEAARRYRASGRDMVVIAGRRYGSGSSRDWAAKGLRLLGVRAVFANDMERIHRSNLIGMGILPLGLPDEWTPENLGLCAADRVVVDMTPDMLRPDALLPVQVQRADGRTDRFWARLLLRTTQEANLIRAGGVIPMMLEAALSRNDLHSKGLVNE